MALAAIAIVFAVGVIVGFALARAI